MVSATCFLLFLIILINIWRIYALVTKQRRRIAGQVGQIRVLEADKKMLAQVGEGFVGSEIFSWPDSR